MAAEAGLLGAGWRHGEEAIAALPAFQAEGDRASGRLAAMARR
jgi:hypothetical protein